MGNDSYLHSDISYNSTIDTILQIAKFYVFDLAYLALHCSNADGMFKVSKMRQQLSHA